MCFPKRSFEADGGRAHTLSLGGAIHYDTWTHFADGGFRIAELLQLLVANGLELLVGLDSGSVAEDHLDGSRQAFMYIAYLTRFDDSRCSREVVRSLHEADLLGYREREP